MKAKKKKKKIDRLKITAFVFVLFLDIDFCLAGVCKNGGSCIEELNGFRCDCMGTGYEGIACELGKLMMFELL